LSFAPLTGREAKVVDQVREWHDKVVAGKYRFRSLVKPPTREGESITAVVVNTGARTVSAHPTADELRQGPLVHDAPETEFGLTMATTQRLMLLGNGHKIKQEWAWQDLDKVEVGAGAQWLTVHPAGMEDEAVAILRRRMGLVGAPKPVEVAFHMLTLEGSWWLAQGKFDGWLSGLAARLQTPYEP
jgi:hypothetical protein